MTNEQAEICFTCIGYKPCNLEESLYVSLESKDGYCVWKETIDNDIQKYKQYGNSACLTFNIRHLVDAQRPKYFGRVTIGGYLDQRMQLQAQGQLMGFDNDELFEIYKSKHIDDIMEE